MSLRDCVTPRQFAGNLHANRRTVARTLLMDRYEERRRAPRRDSLHLPWHEIPERTPLHPSAAAADGLAEEELDLTVQAPEVLLGPRAQGVVQVGRETEEERLALRGAARADGPARGGVGAVGGCAVGHGFGLVGDGQL